MARVTSTVTIVDACGNRGFSLRPEIGQAVPTRRIRNRAGTDFADAGRAAWELIEIRDVWGAQRLTWVSEWLRCFQRMA